MRLLVVGASGLVGAEVVRAAPPDWEVLGVARTMDGLATRAMDLASPQEVLAGFRPELVVVASAWPHVDGCELDPARSHRENVGTVEALVAALGPNPARLLFFSTEHVFDGQAGPYGEEGVPNPLNVYSRHKREVETLLLRRGRSLVVRTSYVFGLEARRKNFLYRVIEAARSGAPLAVPVDQGGMPTWSRWLARSALRLAAGGMEGLVHLTGPEVLSKAQWAARIGRALGLSGLQVEERPWEACGQTAPRPASVALTSRRHALSHPPLDDALQEIARDLPPAS
jgi:dTDP-4-dehydrorhamnose reductase